MKIDLFSIPVFLDTVELDKIKITQSDYQPTFLSKIKTTYNNKCQLSPMSNDYLCEILDRNLLLTGKIKEAKITAIWRNMYEIYDTQEVHIHSNSQWSFIIYETVEKSRTVFLNPAWKSIEYHFSDDSQTFPVTWRPKVDPGTIIIFPSFLEHYVLKGNQGSTIAGNINLTYEK